MKCGVRLAIVVVPLVAMSCGRAAVPPVTPVDAGSSSARIVPSLPSMASAPAQEAPDAGVDGGEMARESRDPDPASRSVTIRLSVAPPTRALVLWGRKRLGELTPERMRLDLERPRGSGPVDIVIRADGFLPHHARLFTDRDDRLSLRLVRPGDARGLLGYRPPASPQP